MFRIAKKVIRLLGLLWLCSIDYIALMGGKFGKIVQRQTSWCWVVLGEDDYRSWELAFAFCTFMMLLVMLIAGGRSFVVYFLGCVIGYRH